MNWLIWREYRRNRWILAMGAVALLLPSLMVFVTNEVGSVRRLVYFVCFCFYASGPVALLAGRASAGDRADHSAEFIAYLPFGRWRMLASKLFLPLIAITVTTGVYLLGLPAGLIYFADLLAIGVTLFVMFGVSWFVSSFQSSTTIACGSGFTAPLLITAFMLLSRISGVSIHAMTPADITAFAVWYALICLPVATVCFSIGTWSYLRRVAP